MRLAKLLACALLALGPLAAADSPELAEAKHKFGLLATRAVANFKSADTIEARLKAQGATLHPQTIALRMRVEAALDETQADLDKGDVAAANKEMTRAQGFLDKFVKRLGGD